MKDLKTIWDELISKYTDNVVLSNELWAEIEKNYTAKKRHYHNFSHLEYMRDKAMEYQDSLTDPDTVLFSIFYHDIIYNPIRQDNERKSAGMAHDQLNRLGIPNDKIARCQQQIIATKEHQYSSDNDTNYLVDMDLAILGESPEIYKDYTRKIRKEYAVYPDFMYNKGRKKVLQHFLDMGIIFKTVAFRDIYEQQARENLNTELQEL